MDALELHFEGKFTKEKLWLMRGPEADYSDAATAARYTMYAAHADELSPGFAMHAIRYATDALALPTRTDETIRQNQRKMAAIVRSAIPWSSVKEAAKKNGYEVIDVKECLIEAICDGDKYLQGLVSDHVSDNPTHLDDAIQVMESGRWNEAKKLFVVLLSA